MTFISLRRCSSLIQSSLQRSRVNGILRATSTTITTKNTIENLSRTNRQFSSSSSVKSLRRKRLKYEQFNEAQLQSHMIPSSSGLEDPFRYNANGSSSDSDSLLDEYTNKANLSPWTPVPDSVARKIFDSAMPTGDDVHVELGSGDGRVNFHAIEYGVGESIGIDVDEDIVQVGMNRLQRIHPQPKIKFVVSDLLDPNSVAWTEYIPKATILTMYFAKDGLEKIRPMLEQTLKGKQCKIYTCGYEMAGWESQMVETVLDMPIHFYDWGNADVEDAIIRADSYVDNLPPGMKMSSPSDNMDQYMRKNKKSTFRPDPLPGFHPDDLIDYKWDDFGPVEQDEHTVGKKR